MGNNFYRIISLFVFVLFFYFFSCSNKIKQLNIITDDPVILEIVNEFSGKNYILINIDLVKLKKDSNVYKYYFDNKLWDYDLVIGKNNSETFIDSKNFLKLNEIYDLLKDQSNNFNLIYDYMKKNSYYSIPYRIDFPVIICRNEVKNFHKDNYITIDQFGELCKKFNIIKDEKKGIITQIGYSPKLSYYRELDYYFIFNSELKIEGSKYNFISPESINAYNFYNNFNDNYFKNYNINDYLNKVNSINYDFYFKKKIIYLDFVSASWALSRKENKILLLKDLKYTGLNYYIASICKSSDNKKSAIDFINYLINFETQNKLYEITKLNRDNYYKEILLPVKKNIIKEFIYENVSYDQYVDNLKIVNFYNFSLQKKFFGKYYSVKDKVNSGLIQQDDFLIKFNNELNLER